MRIAVINGPNLNLLGTREPDIYGSGSWEACEQGLNRRFPEVEFFFHQSNLEGELINLLHQYGVPGPQQADGIVLNAGGYSHTSVAIADAVAAISVPVIGVHISNVYKREPERHMELIAKSATGGIFGLGLEGYTLAVQWFLLRKI
ncbi:MAG: type 3-dehydroquinate dehydratase [Bacteroidota bacterium]|jgi:3-dehydroquinate dehydratase-2